MNLRKVGSVNFFLSCMFKNKRYVKELKNTKLSISKL